MTAPAVSLPVAFDRPALALVLLAATLCLATIGLSQLESAHQERLRLQRRSELDVVNRRADRLVNRVDRRLRQTRWGAWLRVALTGAGLEMRVLDATAIATTVALVAFMVGRLILPEWGALLCAALALRVLWGLVQRERAKRTEVFVAQLPELARVLSNATSAGLVITTAVEMAASELTEPAQTEMRLTAEEIRVGQSLENALLNLERRMPSREVGVLVGTLVVQHRSGGKLVQALRELADTLEARKELRREIRTVMSGAVFSGYLVAAMGAGTIILLNFIKPGILKTMTSSIAGQIAFVIAAVLYAIGFLLIRRVTRIET